MDRLKKVENCGYVIRGGGIQPVRTCSIKPSHKILLDQRTGRLNLSIAV